MGNWVAVSSSYLNLLKTLSVANSPMSTQKEFHTLRVWFLIFFKKFSVIISPHTPQNTDIKMQFSKYSFSNANSKGYVLILLTQTLSNTWSFVWVFTVLQPILFFVFFFLTSLWMFGFILIFYSRSASELSVKL